MARTGKSKAHMKKPGTMARTRTGVSRQLPHQLTMQQAARNTEGRNLWLPGSQLRHKAVNFVKGDNQQPEDTEDLTVPEFDEESIKPTAQTEIDIKEADNTGGNEDVLNECGFFIDLSSQNIEHTGLSNPVSRPHLPSSEDSSGDEIVFHGRSKLSDQKTHSQYQPRIVDEFSHESHDATENRKEDIESNGPGMASLPIIHANESPTQEAAMTSQGRSSVTTERTEHKDDSISLRTKRRFTKKSNLRSLHEDDDDILADYIANIDVDCEETDLSSSADDREIPTFDDEKHEIKSTIQDDVLKTPCLNENRDSASSSGNDDLKEFGFSDSELQSEGDLFDEDRALEETVSYRQKKGVSSKRAKFPSASRFADALESDPYYGFDIMDFNRPSLKKKAKGKRGPPDLMLSDSELEMELEQTWKNDRDKKKSRKQKREELRSQGLLGRSIDKPDLNSRYADGIGMDELKLETRIFLLSSKDSLPLPPMNKQLRKLVHDIANALSLKSHSRGKGSHRFPVLVKTSRTPSYSEQNIFQADKILSRGRFRHRTVKDQSGKSAKSRGRSNAPVSYMDGDVVGASAPEIGVENKGRAMLEKMGWSSGTALGATNNKGILLPVAHVVKKSKAGLG